MDAAWALEAAPQALVEAGPQGIPTVEGSQHLKDRARRGAGAHELGVGGVALLG